MLPIILQHVRELAEVHSGVPESERYKIITPFPPSGQDFPDFEKEALVFGDPPGSGDSASLDTLRAWEFFKRTDNLYYDYSYGIKSEDYHLSEICQKFFLNAQTNTNDLSFRTSFTEKRNAFLNKYLRSTAGDLGQFEFRYTSLSPISWNTDRFVINTVETERLKAKAIKVYEDLELEGVGIVNNLIKEIRSSNYSTIEYDFGFFDVIREWINPRLFEAGEWKFSSGSKTLYGENDPFFANNDVKLCFAQRFYLVKNYDATPSVSLPPAPPVVREHRAGAGTDVRRVVRGAGAHVFDPAEAPGGILVRAGERPVNYHRRIVRNELIRRQLASDGRNIPPVEVPTPVPQPRAGFVWIPATATVPGHWARERAGARPKPVPESPAKNSFYKIAAVKCRVLPPKP